MSSICRWCGGTVDSSGVGGCFCTVSRLRERIAELKRQLAEERARWDWYIENRGTPAGHRLAKGLITKCHEFIPHEWRAAIDEARKGS